METETTNQKLTKQGLPWRGSGGKREGAKRPPLPVTEKKHTLKLSLPLKYFLLAGGIEALQKEIEAKLISDYNAFFKVSVPTEEEILAAAKEIKTDS